MTVSLALRNDPRLPPETRQRIQAIAREMGYRANPLVHALLAQVRSAKPVTRTTTLAFLTVFPTRDGWRKVSNVYREYFDGAQERARQLGYELEEIWAKEPGMTGRRLSRVLHARNIRGLLIGPTPPARGHLSLDWTQFAAATMGYSVWKPDLHRAATDHFQCTTLALRHLKRLGYRRIGLAMPQEVDDRVNHLILAAFLAYQHTLSATRRLAPHLPRVWEQRAFAKWFQRIRPDAVVGLGPRVTLDFIRSCGVRIPQDVGFATFQQTGANDICAGIRQNGRGVGSAVVDLVNGMLQRNERGIPPQPKLVLIRGEWVDGETVRRK